jgi:glycosyltransferase involved in cell wall biosynthesis
MKVVFLGTYDKSKPRNRILLSGIRQNDVDITECHADVWKDEVDKSQIRSKKKQLYYLLRWLVAYLHLTVKYARLPKHDAVLIGYLGQLDVLVFWGLCKLKGVPLIWDAFLSIYDTVVEDRKLAAPKGLKARCIYALEWLACRAADVVVLDTRSHGRYFIETYGISKDKVKSVWVGAEALFFNNRNTSKTTDNRPSKTIQVLFYGQFIPLHGIETIIRAARLAKSDPIKWVLIGKGQEEPKIEKMLLDEPLPKLKRIQWVDYFELPKFIGCSDVCLGIFGKSDKAARVIPNKVFQIVAMGKPFVTRQSPAIREAFTGNEPGIRLISPGDPRALRSAVLELAEETFCPKGVLHEEIRSKIQSQAIGKELLQIVDDHIRQRR